MNAQRIFQKPRIEIKNKLLLADMKYLLILINDYPVILIRVDFFQ